jgi:hypothetical protein
MYVRANRHIRSKLYPHLIEDIRKQNAVSKPHPCI